MKLELPDRWFVKRIKTSQNDAAWWVAANPKRGEGKIFARAEWDGAVAWAGARAKEQGVPLTTQKQA